MSYIHTYATWTYTHFVYMAYRYKVYIDSTIMDGEGTRLSVTINMRNLFNYTIIMYSNKSPELGLNLNGS